MKISEVTKLDLDMAMALQSVLKGAEIKISPTDCGAIGKAVEWFAHMGKELGVAWQMAKVGTQAPKPEVEPETGGLKITSFNPGVG